VFALDANGSVEGIEDEDGDIQDCTGSSDPNCRSDAYRYDPYGELESGEESLSAEAADNTLRFDGFHYDPGSATYDMQARPYRPDIGRFLTQGRSRRRPATWPSRQTRLTMTCVVCQRRSSQGGSISESARRDRALRVYWQGELTDGVLLYGLRAAATGRAGLVEAPWPPGTEATDPWLLHGPGWCVDVWTVRVVQWPAPDRWRSTIEASLRRVVESGYVVAWFSTEGDFVDPPQLFDPRYMGDGMYAACSTATGFLMRDRTGPRLEMLTGQDLLELRAAAEPLWSPSD
jgi:RHS repeat-associated protein